MREKAEKPAKGALRITQQYREAAGMTYELTAEENKLRVRLFENRAAGTWRVELCVNQPDAAVIHGDGATGAAALQAAGDAWMAKAMDQRLPTFDWEAVAEKLRSVRAV